MKILIAEDDAVSRIVLETQLRRLGHDVVALSDGESAWQTFLQERPRLVVTDWMMPIIDGLEFSRRIRGAALDHYTYIIMLTTLIGKKSFLEGMDAGVDDFLNKPVELDSLTARLRVAERIIALQTEVQQLEGLLPICGYCKKIRDERNTWESIEGYISKRTEATFTHGVCPQCYETVVKPEWDAVMRKHAKPASPPIGAGGQA